LSAGEESLQVCPVAASLAGRPRRLLAAEPLLSPADLWLLYSEAEISEADSVIRTPLYVWGSRDCDCESRKCGRRVSSHRSQIRMATDCTALFIFNSIPNQPCFCVCIVRDMEIS